MKQSSTESSSEHILVCVNYGRNAERLIRRGYFIASSLHARMTFLTINPLKEDEYSKEKMDNIRSWKTLANEMGAQFVQEESRSREVSKVIVDVSRRLGITQIVLGQSKRSRWEELRKGSIINSILRQIDFIDLHVVAVQRELYQVEDEFEHGVRACLIPTSDKEYRLVTGTCTEKGIDGIFFKSVYTDFESGVFKYKKDRNVLILKVSEGKVVNGKPEVVDSE